jgi:cation:H+ antiporter
VRVGLDMDALTLVLFIVGFVLLVAGAELLVRGAASLATIFGISPLIVGLTVVAYGTSAPELAVSIQSSYQDQSDIALGNVVGSNIMNVLFVLGLSAAIAPLIVSRRLIQLEVPLIVGISALLWVFARNGQLGRVEGAVLFGGMVGYTVFLTALSRRERQGVEWQTKRALAGRTRPGAIVSRLGMVAAGLVLLVLGADWLVDGAVQLAGAVGVSELVIGLTVVAIGTSLPEVATSIVATIRGQRDIAVGNILGSNICNILLVLGVTSLLVPGGMRVPASALNFDIPIMTAVAVACLPIFFTGHLIARWEGFLLLGYYIAYVLYLLLRSSEHSQLQETFNTVMLAFVLPITAVTLSVVALRALRGRNDQPEDAGG